jgi:hypothetical protein
MQYFRFIPIAALALAAACNDTTTNPTDTNTTPSPVGGPELATTFNPANAPTGTHVQRGTPGCTVNGLTVTCSSFELAGVGNTNATATLLVRYTATINCTNRGGELVEVHSQNVTTSTTTGSLSPENGRLTVPSLSSTAPTAAQILAQASCPNPNWTASVQGGSITISSFTYTLMFAGFSAPYITITGP